jgi:hypothetical protein
MYHKIYLYIPRIIIEQLTSQTCDNRLLPTRTAIYQKSLPLPFTPFTLLAPGCPEPRPEHAKNCVEMGLSMISAIREFDEESIQ